MCQDKRQGPAMVLRISAASAASYGTCIRQVGDPSQRHPIAILRSGKEIPTECRSSFFLPTKMPRRAVTLPKTFFNYADILTWLNNVVDQPLPPLSDAEEKKRVFQQTRHFEVKLMPLWFGLPYRSLLNASTYNIQTAEDVNGYPS